MPILSEQNHADFPGVYIEGHSQQAARKANQFLKAYAR
jgi:hypothetical protein